MKIVAKKANELFQGSGNYHDARFDTAAAYLLVIEGMNKNIIKPGFFSNQLKEIESMKRMHFFK